MALRIRNDLLDSNHAPTLEPPLLVMYWRGDANVEGVRNFLREFIPHPVLFQGVIDGQVVYANVIAGAERIEAVWKACKEG